MSTAVRLGRVRLTAPALRATVTAWMTEESPRITSGYGGWEEVARPRRVALTLWRGRSPYRMTLPLLLDAWDTQRDEDVEADVRVLERMARPAGEGLDPPTVRAEGALPRGSQVEWVVESLEWGESLTRGDGRRVRQAVTVGLLEKIDDVLVVERSAAARRCSIPQATF